MRIGFDAKRAYHNNTGLGNYSRDLIKGLADNYREDEYILFTPKHSNNPRIAFTNYFPNISSRLPKSFLDKRFKSYWRTMNMEKDLILNKIDLFHGLSQEIPRRRNHKIKYVVTIHDLIFLRFPETYKRVDRIIYNKKFKYASDNSDKIIAISKQTKSDLIDFYNIDPEKIKVVYQSCHEQFKEILPQDEGIAIREKYQLPSNYLLSVGTIEKRKNLVALLEAASNIDIPIVVIGNRTAYFQEVSQKVAQLKMKKRVIFLSNIPFKDLPGIYQGAQAFCYPSVFEGFGIPIIEALYSKIPVITTKGGVFAETGGANSIYVDPYNKEEFENQINQVLSSDQSQRVKKGYDFVKKFSTENHVKEIKSIYNELLK
ncbi:glycosyltransferase family 4 protein [Flavobacteriales bacterium]|nr:glycosyltransferase family 4 protein [Flavobacteriales bacterium]